MFKGLPVYKMLEVAFVLISMFSAAVTSEFLVVTHNGPAVLGATVTVRAEVYDDQTNQSITFPCIYGFLFSDDAEPPNQFIDLSKSCSSEWSVTYEPGVDDEGDYNINVVAYVKRGMRFWPIVKVNTHVEITPFLNGEIELFQNGVALRYSDPAFLHSEVSAGIKLSDPDAEFLRRLGASFKTDWSFEVEIACDDCGPSKKEMTRLWLAKNAHPGSSFALTFTTFHGSYVEVRARLCAVVQNSTDLAPLGNTYGFFYRRFPLLDPKAATGLMNFTAESGQKSGYMVVKNGEVDALIIDQ